MSPKMPLSALMLCALPMCAQAQDREAHVKSLIEREQARIEAREREQLKRLSPADAEKLKRLRAASKQSRRHINGKETPELVPYAVRMQQFFHAYQGIFRSQLVLRLSNPDLSVLDEFAPRQSGELKRIGEDQQKEWLTVEPRAKDMSAMEIAAAMQIASDRSDAAQAAMYRKVIEQLSPEGQRVVLEFAFVHVRPQVTITDPLAEAALEPELFREQVLARYEARRAGRLGRPPQDVRSEPSPESSPGSGADGASLSK